jgi:membrane protease subunit (stomatin/prohibitin family)
MGFVSKLRAELVDIIEWIDDSRHTLVWRFPRYHNQIKQGAQLIVRPGQVAVFVHRGKIADVFTPGQYKLSTGNLPVLSTLAGWLYGFDSPFKAEVYFVSTRQITDLKWGTPNPVMMRDTDFGPVRVRAFGTYAIKASNPPTLLSELVGTDQSFEADEIHELLRSIINQAFADVVGKSEIALLDMASCYAELSEQVRRTVVERVDDEYGLEIPQLVIVNISVPAEVEQALDARSSMGVLGNLGAYQAYQLGASMPTAAANPAGGLAGAGVGVGMGMAMAQRFDANAGGGPAPVAPPPVPGAVAWHVVENGHATGPLTTAQLGVAVGAGRVGPDTLVWTAGMPDWQPARQVPALAGLLGGTPPPPPSRG